jgi:DNA modification methylase
MAQKGSNTTNAAVAPERTEYYRNEALVLYWADAGEMPELDNASIDFVVTSPPYWDIKDYGAGGQVGLGQTYGEYLDELSKTLRECFRVLKLGHSLAIVIGTRISDGELTHIPADLMRLMPLMGFTLKKEIIWVKPRGTQGLWQRGTTQFLKEKPFAGCANINIQHESILIFKRRGEYEPDQGYVLSERFIKEVAWSVWQLPVSRTKGHPAPFPEEIPSRLIRLYTKPGETVLDPFIGSGTTAVAAANLGRKCIGYEISEAFCKLTVDNLSKRQPSLQAAD